MAEFKNTFLKGRMNQDLDSRVLPNGEYREAINLMISRSEGSTVGEFENVLGNNLYSLGLTDTHVIGHQTDETNNIVYLFITSHVETVKATSTEDCAILQVNLNTFGITTLVEGFFLNFSTLFPIHATNLVEELLFFTDNRNQPRRINITTAQQADVYTKEAQVAVAQYYPYDPIIPMFRQTVTVAGSGNTTTQITITAANANVKVGDIVTPNDITTLVTNQPIQNILPQVTVVEIISSTVFRVSPAITPAALPAGTLIDFSRTSMRNEDSEYVSNFSINTVALVNDQGTNNIKITTAVLGGIPRIGDLVKNITTPGNIPANLRVLSINISTTATAEWIIVFDKQHDGGSFSGFVIGDTIAIGVNPDYNVNFKGDAEWLDDKFVRFSYRLRFKDSEYSLMAPFTQIMFIPKQYGEFGLGQLTPQTGENTNYYQDEIDAYTSTILQWFENDIDTIDLKIPIPSNLVQLSSIYNVKQIDILYRESDAIAVKVLDTIDVNVLTSSQISTINYNDDLHGLIEQNFVEYKYKSNKPYKTLPESQTVRVFDKVPIKALGQELISNRIVYGNYLEKQTPPSSIAYRTTFTPRDAQSSDYTTQYPYSSVKQNRTYQVGFVLADYYGRQSDVILSSFDNTNDSEGSSIYVPYRNSGDATSAQVLSYIGTNLSLSIDEAIGTGTDPGQPGLYNEEGQINSFTISNIGGATYVPDTNYATTSSGDGTGCVVRVTATDVNPGKVTTVALMVGGSGYEVGDVLTIAGGTATITITAVNIANPLGWYTYKVVVKQQEQEYYNVYMPGFVNGLPINNLLWNGVPRTASLNVNPGSSTIETERNKIFFSTILSDNINKIPRNLTEVGPTDEEYNSDEILFIRVNNPNTKAQDILGGGVRNLQYYPNTLNQNVLNLSTVRESELAPVPFQPFSIGPDISALTPVDGVGNEVIPAFSVSLGYQGDYGSTTQYVPRPLTSGKGVVVTVPTGSIPWGDVANAASFYAADQNPFIMKAGQVSNWGNPVGAIVCGGSLLGPSGGNNFPHDTNFASGVRTMQPTLSVAETKPVFSVLDIFWETTMAGRLEDLNSAINTNYDGLVAITDNFGSYAESVVVNSSVGDPFYFVNGSGAQITNYSTITIAPVITGLARQSAPGTPLVPGDFFDIVQTGTAGQYSLRNKKTFVFTDTSEANSTDVYLVTISAGNASSTNQVIGDTFINAITLNLTNVAPVSYSDANRMVPLPTIPNPGPYTISVDSLATAIATFYGRNGSAETINDAIQLSWSLGIVLRNDGAGTNPFIINSSTGVLTASGLVNDKQYSVQIILKDANGGTGSISLTRTIAVNVGVPLAPKAIASARQNTNQLTGAGNKGAWYWVNQVTPSDNPTGYSIIYNAQTAYRASTAPVNTCEAWLFQGTMEIEVIFAVAATSQVGDASVQFQIEQRSYDGSNRGSWNKIDSVVEVNFDTQTASSGFQSSSLTVGGNQTRSETFLYKFNTLGEYRVITNSQGLFGDRASFASVNVNFKDGKCRNDGGAYCGNSGPCNPS
tara:strand:+ start:724 stop:5301 length:4578 start_codon:yes stop_codon:yes gene_type:complete